MFSSLRGFLIFVFSPFRIAGLVRSCSVHSFSLLCNASVFDSHVATVRVEAIFCKLIKYVLKTRK